MLLVSDLDLANAATVGIEIFDHQCPLGGKLPHLETVGDRDLGIARTCGHTAIAGVRDTAGQIDHAATRTQRLDDQLGGLPVIDQREIISTRGFDCCIVRAATLCSLDLVGNVGRHLQIEDLLAGLNIAIQVDIGRINRDHFGADVRRVHIDLWRILTDRGDPGRIGANAILGSKYANGIAADMSLLHARNANGRLGLQNQGFDLNFAGDLDRTAIRRVDDRQLGSGGNDVALDRDRLCRRNRASPWIGIKGDVANLDDDLGRGVVRAQCAV